MGKERVLRAPTEARGHLSFVTWGWRLSGSWHTLVTVTRLFLFPRPQVAMPRGNEREGVL